MAEVKGAERVPDPLSHLCASLPRLLRMLSIAESPVIVDWPAGACYHDSVIQCHKLPSGRVATADYLRHIPVLASSEPWHPGYTRVICLGRRTEGDAPIPASRASKLAIRDNLSPGATMTRHPPHCHSSRNHSLPPIHPITQGSCHSPLHSCHCARLTSRYGNC